MADGGWWRRLARAACPAKGLQACQHLRRGSGVGRQGHLTGRALRGIPLYKQLQASEAQLIASGSLPELAEKLGLVGEDKFW